MPWEIQMLYYSIAYHLSYITYYRPFYPSLSPIYTRSGQNLEISIYLLIFTPSNDAEEGQTNKS